MAVVAVDNFLLWEVEDGADKSKRAWKLLEERLFKLLITEIQMYKFCPERESGAFVLCHA